MSKFIRVKTENTVMYYSVDRIVSVEVDHEHQKATMIHDGTGAAVVVEGESYGELISILGHDLIAAGMPAAR